MCATPTARSGIPHGHASPAQRQSSAIHTTIRSLAGPDIRRARTPAWSQLGHATGPQLEIIADAGDLADQLVLLDHPGRHRRAGGEVECGHHGAQLHDRVGAGAEVVAEDGAGQPGQGVGGTAAALEQRVGDPVDVQDDCVEERVGWLGPASSPFGGGAPAWRVPRSSSAPVRSD